MLLARWLSAAAITQSYAVHESALFRYSQRGMLGARWDEATRGWLYDVMRVRELFLHRDAQHAAAPDTRLGTLGETRLAGAGPARRPDARQARQALHVREAKAPGDAATASDMGASSNVTNGAEASASAPAGGGQARLTRAS